MRLLDLAVLPYPRRRERPLIIGHRGASALAPENTLESFALAMAHGADGVELDVACCGSGEVVVCHDPRLDRLAGAPVEVRTTPLRALRELDVARHFAGWGKPARIPTLDEVLEAQPGAWVNIELKEEGWRDGGLAAKVAAIVQRHGAERRVIISSFNPLELLRLRLRAPRLPIGFIFEAAERRWLRSGFPAPILGAQAIHPEHLLCTPRRVSAWQAAGFAVATWTVDDPVRAAQLRGMGVDALITNQPRRTREALLGSGG